MRSGWAVPPWSSSDSVSDMTGALPSFSRKNLEAATAWAQRQQSLREQNGQLQQLRDHQARNRAGGGAQDTELAEQRNALHAAPLADGSRAADIRDMARRKIAEAEAAIAAAEASAMRTMKDERFSPHRIPPWVMPVAGTQAPSRSLQPQVHGAAAPMPHVRHQTQQPLNTPDHMTSLQSARVRHVAHPSSSVAHGQNKGADAPVGQGSLPDGAINRGLAPHQAQSRMQLPVFARQPDLPSFPRVGSGTIGWAGPWVSSHRQGGIDRMYPAHLRAERKRTCDDTSQIAPRATAAQSSTCQWSFESDVAASVKQHGSTHALSIGQRMPVNVRPAAGTPIDGAIAHAARRDGGGVGAEIPSAPRNRDTPMDRLKSRQGLRRTQSREASSAAGRAHLDSKVTRQAGAQRLPAARRVVPRPEWCTNTSVAHSTDSEQSAERMRAVPAKPTARHNDRPPKMDTTVRHPPRAAPRVRPSQRQGDPNHDEVPAVVQERQLSPRMQAPHVAMEPVPGEALPVLQQCPTCSRSFRPQALVKHAAVCSKVFAQKRRVYDSKSARTPEGAESAQAMPRGGKSGASHHKRLPTSLTHPVRHQDRPAQSALGKASSWKQKSETFRAAMRASRQINAAEERGEDIRQLPIFETQHDDRVPCPHCGRKFAPLTADRHIPKCKNIRAKPAFLKRGSGKGCGRFGVTDHPGRAERAGGLV